MRISIIWLIFLVSFSLKASDLKKIEKAFPSPFPLEIYYILLNFLNEEQLVHFSLMSKIFNNMIKNEINKELKDKKYKIILFFPPIYHGILMDDVIKNYKTIYYKKKHKYKGLLTYFLSSVLNYVLIIEIDTTHTFHKIHHKKTKYIKNKICIVKKILNLLDKGPGYQTNICYCISQDVMMAANPGITPLIKKNTNFECFYIDIKEYKELYRPLREYTKKHEYEDKTYARNHSWFLVYEYILNQHDNKKYQKIFENILNQIHKFLKRYENKNIILDLIIAEYKRLNINDQFIEKLLISMVDMGYKQSQY